jgi:hypothetical protein
VAPATPPDGTEPTSPEAAAPSLAPASSVGAASSSRATDAQSIAQDFTSALADIAARVTTGVFSTASKAIATGVVLNAGFDRVITFLPDGSVGGSAIQQLFSRNSIIDDTVRAAANQLNRIVAAPFGLSNNLPQSPLFSTTQIYHYARLGNPVAMLSQSLDAFLNDLASGPPMRRLLSPWRASLITAVVAVADLVVLHHLRKSQRREVE